MTKNEQILFSEAVYWYKQYDDSNPDVGMGPSIETIIKTIENRTGIKMDSDSLHFIKMRIKQ